MAFLRKITNREGKIYLSMVESYRKGGKMKQRTIKSFGRLDILELQDKDPWNTCKLIVEEYNNEKTEPIIKKVSVTQARTSKTENFGFCMLNSIYKTLSITNVLDKYSKNKKFTYSLDEVMKLLVFGRCLDPKSKSKTVEQFQKTLFGNWNISQNDMDRALDHFDKVKEDVQLAIHKSITQNIGRCATLVFYDVTNYYFETDLPDDFRKRGYSKENRKSPIVQMGLFMDMNGIPIAYKLFEGNCTDPKTYMPAVEQVKKQFGIKRIVTVADKAMNSSKNVIDATSKGDGYLFSSKFRGQKGSRKDLQDFILDTSGWKFNKKQTFALKSTVLTRKLTNGKTVQEKVVVTWREKYAIREKLRRDGVLQYTANMQVSQMKRILLGKSQAKYYDVQIVDKNGEDVKLNSAITLDEKKVRFEELFDGMNVITTSELNMSDSEIIAAYKQLNRIEDCFRITKTDLRSRPVFVWTKEHIEAHFLTCFIALVIVKVLHYKLGGEFSVRRIIEGLRKMEVRSFAQGYYETFVNEDTQAIVGKLGVKWDTALLSVNVLENLAK